MLLRRIVGFEQGDRFVDLAKRLVRAGDVVAGAGHPRTGKRGLQHPPFEPFDRGIMGSRGSGVNCVNRFAQASELLAILGTTTMPAMLGELVFERSN